jgi:DNA-binding SARP family transcriptional activator
VTESGGYRLQVGDGSVDAAVFERQVRTGQAMLAEGALAEAAAELERALSLWRGDVLADLAHFAFVPPFARRLEEIRLAAIESKIDAELALGRHVSVVPELDELVGRHPLRERLQAQRMLALYRCGRQCDALAAYHGLRQVLDEELGIEPSVPLQQLHRAVLAQDPDLAWDRHLPRLSTTRYRLQSTTSFRRRGRLLADGAACPRGRLLPVLSLLRWPWWARFPRS